MDASQIQNLSPQQREELMKNVQAQVALAQMQELLTVSFYFIGLLLRLLWKIQFIKNCFDLQKTTDKCFKKCVSSPSSSLGSGEQVPHRDWHCHRQFWTFVKNSLLFRDAWQCAWTGTSILSILSHVPTLKDCNKRVDVNIIKKFPNLYSLQCFTLPYC